MCHSSVGLRHAPSLGWLYPDFSDNVNIPISILAKIMKYGYTLYYSNLAKVYSKVYIPNIFIYLYLKYRYNYISKFENFLSPKVLPDYLIPNFPWVLVLRSKGFCWYSLHFPLRCYCHHHQLSFDRLPTSDPPPLVHIHCQNHQHHWN